MAVRVGASERCERFREAEVQNLDLASRSQEQVRGFEVAVQHAARVRHVERVGQIDCRDRRGAPLPAARVSTGCCRVSPSSNSITRKLWLSWRPTSKSEQMFGCVSAAIARASRSKRASACASPTLRRAGLDGDVAIEPRVLRAIDLTIPPAPMGAMIS
jgi:hypothetical protein